MGYGFCSRPMKLQKQFQHIWGHKMGRQRRIADKRAVLGKTATNNGGIIPNCTLEVLLRNM